MLANLDRDKFIELLGKLGEEKDEEVLSAARDLHAQVTVAQLSWDDLLVPDQIDEIVEQGDENNDEPTDKADPQEVENVSNGKKGSDISDEENEKTLTEDEKLEALSLIEKILSMEVSKDTKDEVEEYKQDIEDGDFVQMDLSYLRAFHKRLSK
tara:strand:- start:144 stop:605 length:462 start_codon:yes stop_codon:yes gene_type:complete